MYITTQSLRNKNTLTTYFIPIVRGIIIINSLILFYFIILPLTWVYERDAYSSPIVIFIVFFTLKIES